MDRLEMICRRFEKMLAGEKAVYRKIENSRELLAELISRPDWFFSYLKKMILEPGAFKNQKPGIWPNEYTLYRSPDKSFIALAYIWDVGERDIVHDHGSWGVIGTLFETLGEDKYERLDDGKTEGYAELRQTARGIFGPGQTTFVLPVDEGIHAMENPGSIIGVSVNVYGKPIGRGYTQFFNPDKKTVSCVYPPATTKEVLAVKTLAAIDPAQSEAVFREALRAPHSPRIRQVYEAAITEISRSRSTSGQERPA